MPLPPAAPVLPLLPAVLPATALPTPPEGPALLALPMTPIGTCGEATPLSVSLPLLPLGPVAATGVSPLLLSLPSALALLPTGPSGVLGVLRNTPLPAGSLLLPAPAAGVSAPGLLPPGGDALVGLASSLTSVPCPMPLQLLTSELPSVDAALMGMSAAGCVREPLLQSTSSGRMHSTSPMEGLGRVLQ